MADQEDEKSERKPFKLFWILDVDKIPCARESILYGSIGSLFFGASYFLTTSRVRRSCDVAVGGFLITTTLFWLCCRYNHAELQIQKRIVESGIKNKILYEGTAMDPNLKNSQRNDSDQ